MLQLKDGVLLAGNKYINEMLHAVQVVLDSEGVVTVVTSGRDSHDTGYHPQDRAIDVRFWDIPPEKRRAIAERFRNLLPKYYDIVLERDHWHLEADRTKEGVPVSNL